jgi:methyl-accepting chemotaxis protein
MSGASSKVNSSSRELSELAEELNRMVKHFKL